LRPAPGLGFTLNTGVATDSITIALFQATKNSGTLAGYATSTKVGIGKASLVLQQEENNTNLK
jgi:hypothetical protein